MSECSSDSGDDSGIDEDFMPSITETTMILLMPIDRCLLIFLLYIITI